MDTDTLQPAPTAAVPSIYNQSSCPVCGQRSSSKESIHSTPRAESLPFDDLKSGWYGFFKAKSFFSYHRCPTCSTLYCPQYFTTAQLDQLYHQMPDNTAGVSLEALRKTQEGYFRFLQKHAPLTGEYLEVGPDIGLFTNFAVREGHFDRFWMFEPNQAMRPTLENLLAGRAHDIQNKFLDLQSLPDGRLSTVVMVHVLDHLTDPLALLKDMKRKLAPGAHLLFVTHDESSLLAKLIKAKWPPYCLQHPLLFNPKTITGLLKAAGYNVVSIKKSANHYPLTYLAKHALWVAGWKVSRLPAWEPLTLPIKLGNIMTLAQI